MTTIGTESSALSFLAGLAEPALRVAVLAVVAGVALTLLRVRRTSVKLCVWTIVLGAALAMPALDLVMPALPLRVLPAAIVDGRAAAPRPVAIEATRAPSTPAVPRSRQATAPTTLVGSGQSIATSPTSSPVEAPALEAPTPAVPSVSWPLILFVAYLVGALALLARAVIGWFATRRFARGTTSIDDPTALAQLHAFAAAAGLAHSPRLAESDACLVPITMGIAKPVIVLPSDWREWSATTLDAVMLHELAHVGRRDVLTQGLSLLHRAIFWFNPLSWWLRRHLVQLAEYASDEAVLAGGVEQTTYAEALLGFFTSLGPDHRRAEWHVAMAQGSGPERRIGRILAWTEGRAHSLTTALSVAIALVAMPTVAVVAAIQPARAMVELPPVATSNYTSSVTPAPMTVARLDAARPHAAASEMTLAAPQEPAAIQQPTPQTPAPLNAPAAAADGHRLFILLLDESMIATADAQKAVDASLKWVAEKMTPTDMVATASIGSTLKILSDFTNDAAKIRTGLQGFTSGVGQPPVATGAFTATAARNQFLSGMTTLCQSLTPLQGKKAILLFSGGLARTGQDNLEALRFATDACSRAGTMINPVDVRGLPAEDMTPIHFVTKSGTNTVDSSALSEAAIKAASQWTFRPTVTPGLVDSRGKPFFFFNDPRAAEAQTTFTPANFPNATSTDLNNARALYGLLTGRASQSGGTDQQNAKPAPLPCAAAAETAAPGLGVVNPTLLHEQKPTYPAGRDGPQGNVWIDVTVMPDGTTCGFTVTKSLDPSPGGLDEAAVRAASRWTFKPGTRDSVPVPVRVSLEMTFRVSVFAPGVNRPGDPGLTVPKLLYTKKPLYTADAIREKIQGVVEFECVVLPDGTVGEFRFVKSLDSTYGLDNQAIVALAGYRFTPGTLNGQPVPVVVHIEMTFTLR